MSNAIACPELAEGNPLQDPATGGVQGEVLALLLVQSMTLK